MTRASKRVARRGRQKAKAQYLRDLEGLKSTATGIVIMASEVDVDLVTLCQLLVDVSRELQEERATEEAHAPDDYRLFFLQFKTRLLGWMDNNRAIVGAALETLS